MELAKSMGYSAEDIATYNASLTANAADSLVFINRCNVIAGPSSESLGAGYLLSNPGTKAIHIVPYEVKSQTVQTVEKIAKAAGPDYHTLQPVLSKGIHLRTDVSEVDDVGVKNAVCAYGIEQLTSHGNPGDADRIKSNTDF